MSANNPQMALDALLENPEQGAIQPLSIARVALLEMVESPVITGAQLDLGNAIPTIYILTQPISALKKYSRKSIDQLRQDAVEWADGLGSVEDFTAAVYDAVEKLNNLTKLTPKGGEDKKKPQSAAPTAG